MPLLRQTNDIAKPVNNDGKQIGGVTSQYAYIERFQLGDCGILPLTVLLLSIPEPQRWLHMYIEPHVIALAFTLLDL